MHKSRKKQCLMVFFPLHISLMNFSVTGNVNEGMMQSFSLRYSQHFNWLTQLTKISPHSLFPPPSLSSPTPHRPPPPPYFSSFNPPVFFLFRQSQFIQHFLPSNTQCSVLLLFFFFLFKLEIYKFVKQNEYRYSVADIAEKK